MSGGCKVPKGIRQRHPDHHRGRVLRAPREEFNLTYILLTLPLETQKTLAQHLNLDQEAPEMAGPELPSQLNSKVKVGMEIEAESQISKSRDVGKPR